MTYLEDLKALYPSVAGHIDCVPEHMHDGVCLWLLHGIAPGSFLSAVICNDLKESFGRADEINRDCLFEWVQFFYNHTPHDCWGSEERAAAWAKRGGLRGRKAEVAG
jgi:hypothetical protein